MRKIPLILGILGILLGGAVLLISLLLPNLTRNVSWEEAMLGIIPGALILFASIIVAVVGVVLILMKRKKTAG